MRQRIADALQVVGAIGLTVGAATISLTLGLIVGGMSSIVAGITVAAK